MRRKQHVIPGSRPRSAAKPSDSSTSWRPGLGFKLWCLQVSKYEVVCRVYKKVSSGWISDMTLTFFGNDQPFVHWINWLSFQSVFPNNTSPASNALVLGSQVLRRAKLRACFNIFLVSDIFVKQRRIHVAAKGSPPVWRPEPRKTGLDVSNSQNKLDVPWFPSP